MIRILLIDNHSIVLAGLGHLIDTQEDFKVVGLCKNSDEALHCIEKGVVPDVIITDLDLGGRSGIELSALVKQQLPNVQSIILTLEQDERFVSDAFKAGIKGYLLKQTGHDELFFAIRKVHEGRCYICTELAERLSERLSRNFYGVKANNDIILSSREAEILHLLADGYTNLEIADRLFTSRRTVEGHRQSLLNKTGVRNTPELIKFAMLHGLLQIQMAS